MPARAALRRAPHRALYLPNTAHRCCCSSQAGVGPLSVNDPSTTVLGFPQWQGAGLENAERYQLGGPMLHRSVCALLPRAKQCVVHVAPDEPGPAARLNQVDEWWGQTVIERQQAQARALLSEMASTRVVAVGGDCGIEPAIVGFLTEKYGGDLAVLWLDAHADLNEPQHSPSGLFHGMALRACLEPVLFGGTMACQTVPQPVSHAHVVLAGTRSLDQPERSYLAEHNMSYLPPGCLEHCGNGSDHARSALLDALARTSANNLYVHIDLDVVDPSHLPHVGVPEPDGISPGALLQLIAQVAKQWRGSNGASKVVGLSVTEFAPQSQSTPVQQHATIAFVTKLVEELFRGREDDRVHSLSATSSW